MFLFYTLLNTALPCGGFFCGGTSVRVDQAGERIVFFVDIEEQTTEMHVEVTYDGPAEEFAWIVPTPSEPELLLSSTSLFDMLEEQTAPTYTSIPSSRGPCPGRINIGCTRDLGIAGNVQAAGQSPEVIIGTEATVGAFETVSLQARSTDALLTWLQDNDYDIPDSSGPALAPYIAEGSWFLALRLANDADAGTLDPIALRFRDTTTPTIPLRLTSIAATPDMPVTAWVISELPYGPANVPRVHLNPTRIDRWGGLTNYESQFSAAVDEAGGEAWHADTRTLNSRLPWLHRSELDDLPDELAQIADPGRFLDRLLQELQTVAPIRRNVVGVGDTLLPCMPGGLTAWGEPGLFADQWRAFDPVACSQLVEERILEPRRRVNDAVFRGIDRAVELQVTRWRTVISPGEMRTDPVFEHVLELDISSNNASDISWCGTGNDRLRQRRTLEIDDYRIPMPSAQWLRDEGLTNASWIELADAPAAERVQMRTADGRWETLVDQREVIADALGALRGEGPAGRGCGVSPDSRGMPLLLGLLLVLRRRRS